MHLHGRPFAFNEQNIAAIRKLMAPGPLPLWSSTIPGPNAAAVNNNQGGDEGKRPVSSAPKKAVRTAAVLIPLCNRDGVASMLFTVRTSKVSTHKGQVSFPGGHIEAGEAPIDAALRETREEVGEGLGHVEVLGICQTLPAVTGTLVTPVLAFVKEDIGPRLSDLVLSPDEVDSVFILSVSELLDPAFRVVDDLGLRGKLPAFTAGPSRVWGLTALITDGILQQAIIPLVDGKISKNVVDDSEGLAEPQQERSKGTGVSSL